MPAPSPLAIATGSVTRLLKEESSYYKEQEQQQKRIKSLEQNPGDDENAEFQMRQEVSPTVPKANIVLTEFQRRALEETKAVFPPLRQRIKDAAAKLEQQLVSGCLASY